MKQKTLQKIVSIFAILAMLMGLFALFTPSAQAFDFDDIFKEKDEGLSFTQYEGGLAELNDQGYDASLVQSNDAREFILKIVNFALSFLGLIAVIVVIYGGVLYVTAAGEQEKTDKGKKAITYAAIGLLIVLGSFAFVNTIISGASDGSEPGSGAQYVVGPNQGGSFNASASNVQTIARAIYSEFTFFAETIEELETLSSDLRKDSLRFAGGNPVAKKDMLNYLFSAKSKLSLLNSKLPKFSLPYNQISEIIRGIDSKIDRINSLNRTSWVKIAESGISYEKCPVDSGFACIQANYLIEYPINLFETWADIKAELLGDSEQSYNAILPKLKKNFLDRFDSHIEELIAIKASLVGIEAAENGSSISTIYDKMNLYFDQFRAEIVTINEIVQDITTFDEAGAQLFLALEQQVLFRDALLQLQSVIARLRADVTTGNAPLYVTFDVLESIDPAGGSIVDVDWDNITGKTTNDGTDIGLPANAVVCDQLNDPDLDLVGSAFRQCIFKYPGTYQVAVKINSNEQSKYVSGLSTLTIKVNPPITKINLKASVASKEIPILEYYNNGIVKVDEDTVPVTTEEASAGISFDATGTENIINYRWNFGDGSSEEGAALNTVNHPYELPGKYLVTLEVTNKLNQVDRKIFTLDVGSVAGRIRVRPPDNVFINSQVRFDADQSTANGGTIRGYEWKITKSGSNEALNLGNDGNKRFFIYQFEEPGKYNIDLTVSSDAGVGQAATYELDVKSKDPVAIAKYEIPKKTQPSTVHLSSFASFDPDGDKKNLSYQWQILPASENGVNWEVVDGAVENNFINQANPIVRFNKIGDYEITLKTSDIRTQDSLIDEEFGEDTIQIEIDNILDIEWSTNQEVTAMVDEQGFAEIDFTLISKNAVAYEIDFGDGDVESGDFDQQFTVTHRYASAGKYNVEVRVYDEDDNDNTIRRRFFIGGGDKPIARASVSVNGNEIIDLDEPITVSTEDLLIFDASNSKNNDGTGRDLTYQWQFGDTNTSSQKQENHRYRELSPVSTGFYTVKLKVADKDDPTKFDEDEIFINVVNEAPFFSAVQGVISRDQIGELITPVQVNMNVYGAEDRDGEIVKYKWWYFDIDDPSEQLGIQITKAPNATLTIGTHGKEGQELTYGFGLEVTDSDGLVYSNQEAINNGQYSTVEVLNGANTIPLAKFDVNVTSTSVGEEINFTSSSTDPDGRIMQYIWDLEGDGFFNNEPSDQASLQHIYQTKNTDGYQVKLKVIDDKGGEAVSEPITIFVDSNAEAPVAAFQYRVIDGSQGMKIKFTNNSTADQESGANIFKYQWDFDTNSRLPVADSDGDGEKDNDNDSNTENPTRLYTEIGSYSVKLTVTDDQGNTDSVTNPIQIPLSEPPTAAFKFKVLDGKVSFENNSQPDPKTDAKIEEYIWDFDTDSELETADSDGDGNLENDQDSKEKNPLHQYALSGSYNVKLTVVDNQGNRDEITRLVPFSAVPGAELEEYNQNPDIRAVLRTEPVPQEDGVVYLRGTKGRVKFDFSESLGSIAFYLIDKNINIDSDGDGIKDNDEDFRSVLPGTWTTNYDSQSGPITAQLTISDIRGSTNKTEIQIKFY